MLITLKIKKIDNKTYERNFSKRVKIWKQNFGRKIMTKFQRIKLLWKFFWKEINYRSKCYGRKLGTVKEGLKRSTGLRGPPRGDVCGLGET